MLIGERIKKERNQKGLTQKELAERLGVTTTVIGQYERTERTPKMETLVKIAEALELPGYHLLCKHFNVSADYLLGLAEDKVQQNPSAVTVVQIPDEVSGLISDYQKLDWDGQKAVIRTIDKELERIKSGNAESGAS